VLVAVHLATKMHSVLGRDDLKLVSMIYNPRRKSGSSFVPRTGDHGFETIRNGLPNLEVVEAAGTIESDF